MSFFPMSQDAQILTDHPNCLTDDYPNYKTEDILEPTPQEISEGSTKKPTKKWAHPKFVLSSFQLYETKTRYYVIGTNEARQRYRVLKIDRTNPNELDVFEDDVLYTEQEKTRLLKMIEDGNLSVGGLQLSPMEIHGLVGFIKFTQGWYMIFITKRRQVAVLGGHYVYHIDKTRLIPVGPQVKLDKNSDEARYITTFQNIDLAKNFYFSYTYDLTNSLQTNLTRPPSGPNDDNTSKDNSASKDDTMSKSDTTSKDSIISKSDDTPKDNTIPKSNSTPKDNTMPKNIHTSKVNSASRINSTSKLNNTPKDNDTPK
ncbi:phosphatidylinositol-3,5-bisphosphate 5-phosphatase, partial [Rhizopus stolonifer]